MPRDKSSNHLYEKGDLAKRTWSEGGDERVYTRRQLGATKIWLDGGEA